MRMVRAVADYLAKSGVHAEVTGIRLGYSHMGATLTDAILQAGVRYETVVKPRVERIMKKYPNARLTAQFVAVLENDGAHEVLLWAHQEKPRRLMGLALFLDKESVQTEVDLAEWLRVPANRMELRRQKGIGPKTVDYLRLLCGHETFAVDRHIHRLVEQLCGEPLSYTKTHEIMTKACDELGWSASVLDMILWKILSQDGGLRSQSLSQVGGDTSEHN